MNGHSVETRVALVEHRQGDNDNLIEKLSHAIQAIQDLASSLNQVIKIHEFKIEQRILAERDLYDTIEQSQVDVDKRLSAVDDRINKAVARVEVQLEATHQAIAESINKNLEPLKHSVTKLEDQVQTYRYWTWGVTGALIALSFFIPGGLGIVGALLRI
ncbi:MAG: hypothetical protein DDT26_00309 [Dehalococcoidia bacterium]|nr:hypothetical protein [Chloroflexota bacterium]